MSKSAITRIFIAGAVAMVVGVILEAVAVIAALAGGVITVGGPTIVSLNLGDAAWNAVAFFAVGALALTVGSVAGVISWIGALFNTWKLEDRTWFSVLLALGLFSFGYVAMIAYLLRGPDGTKAPATTPGVASASPA